MNLLDQTFNIDSLPDTSMVREAQVRAHLAGISRPTLMRWIDKGMIPVPLKINGVRYWQAGQLRDAMQKLTEPSQPESQVQA